MCSTPNVDMVWMVTAALRHMPLDPGADGALQTSPITLPCLIDPGRPGVRRPRAPPLWDPGSGGPVALSGSAVPLHFPRWQIMTLSPDRHRSGGHGPVCGSLVWPP